MFTSLGSGLWFINLSLDHVDLGQTLSFLFVPIHYYINYCLLLPGQAGPQQLSAVGAEVWDTIIPAGAAAQCWRNPGQGRASK